MLVHSALMFFSVFSVALLVAAVSGCSDSAGGSTPVPPRVILSTDVANGLIDTHGAQGSCPVSFDAAASYFNDSDYQPQDVDDGLALAAALNLDAAGLLRVEGVVPTYGNATLPPTMLVARQIVVDLKGRGDIPVVPGAMAPAAQVLRAAPRWFDDREVAIAGPAGSFAASCRNAGVDFMRRRLMDLEEPVSLLAVGPLTDVACLLTIYPDVASSIAEIVVLGSRVEGDSLTVNGKVVNDFNFRTDPLGGAMLLAAATSPRVPIRLMAFRLTGQTSQDGDVIVLDASTLHGPDPPTEASQRSLAWLTDSAEPRQEFWSGIFGTPEGPFDQYVVAAVVWPDLFDCRPGLAYVQMCPVPAWSAEYPVDADGQPTEHPFNAEDNPCVDHGSANGGSLAAVPAQLVVALGSDASQPLVRGLPGVDGNIPDLGPARQVTVCVDFADATARRDFEDLLLEYTW